MKELNLIALKKSGKRMLHPLWNIEVLKAGIETECNVFFFFFWKT